MQLGQVDQLVQDFHFWVQPAFFWHVADVGAVPGGDGRVIDGDGAGILVQHADNDAHGGGFAGAVATHKPRHDAWFDGKAHVGEDLVVAERLLNILESDHNQFMLHAPGWSPHGVVKSQRSPKATKPSRSDVLKAGIQRTPAFSMRYVLIEVAS